MFDLYYDRNLECWFIYLNSKRWMNIGWPSVEGALNALARVYPMAARKLRSELGVY